ncbi:hypothetical protein N7539_004921 [Penicillium diatomitis]|uniref:Conserved oligomeric Golgi complex subunit 1 n=1 Tax=Penicillium diatomitis TaxID=2819901 RepID=A0A9X0BUA1_9EURO|nr:uncharacterized protein N7539_004921 [Penicillium diatomitis]KAJ5484933.1 hypothetical protein N7539_004921 [Penicillium diatomitis]
MTPDAPDPQSLKSWQDAFQYPIPTVRRLEQELRRDIASNREKLRALVGTRYRELVGTAETIVDMHREIQDVEGTLIDVARRCNPRLVEKKHQHARQMKRDATNHDADKHSFGAQMALLHRCTTTITRLLRRRASLLLTAKILVISRLLLKTLSQSTPSPPFLEDLRNQLANLRRTLLKRVDKKLASAKGSDENIIESLSAFCLATSSSFSDAVHHFHQVRLDMTLGLINSSHTNIPRALHLFVRTLQNSKMLQSRQFNDALSKLKSQPILSDPDVLSLEGLEIDILSRWAAPEVLNFTPWIRLNESTRSEALQSTKQWSATAFTRFEEASREALAQGTDFVEMLELRTGTIEFWLSSWGSTTTHGSNEVFEHLRKLFNDVLKRILTDKVSTITSVAAQISSAVRNWEIIEHEPVHSLWDHDMISHDYSDGASQFKRSVLNRLYGRDEDVTTALKQYQSWLTSVRNVHDSIESLRRHKWTDVLITEGEDVEVMSRLNSNDPQLLSHTLRSATHAAYQSLQESFNTSCNEIGASFPGQKSTFLLRLVRHVRRDIPPTFVTEGFLFADSLVAKLQTLLAEDICSNFDMAAFVGPTHQRSKAGGLRNVPGRSLWEGEPPTPVQPSPTTFKFLRHLTAILEQRGSDLWDPSTTRILKKRLGKLLNESLKSAMKELETGEIESGNTASPASSDQGTVKNDSQVAVKIHSDKDISNNMAPQANDASNDGESMHDWKVQLLFDAWYLTTMLGDSSQLDDAILQVQASVAPSPEMIKTIQTSAKDYWKRTELLFGLLARP